MSRIPETDLHVGEFIFSNINLKDSQNFQLLHNDVSKGDCYCYQIYGRFFGHEKDESNFELSKIEFKLVHIAPGNSEPYYKVHFAELIRRNDDESDIDIDVTIKLEKPRDSTGKNVKNVGIDCTLPFNDGFDISYGEMIDYHVEINGVNNRNGRPCKNKATRGS